MMVTWTLAKKDLRLLLRDRRAVIILLAMPFLFILVLGLSLGEGFGQKPAERLRVTIVDLDEGYRLQEGMSWAGNSPESSWHRQGLQGETAWLALSGSPGAAPPGLQPHALAALALAEANATARFPDGTWAKEVENDLEQTGSIRLEFTSLEEARKLIANGDRAAVVVFGPRFSEQVARCSFLREGINPFYRDGIDLSTIDAAILRDDKQLTAASIIEQVAQVALLRVILPWMIGRAFEAIGEPDFIDKLSQTVEVPLPLSTVKVALKNLLTTLEQKQAVGSGVQKAIQDQFPKYNLTGKTWASLTKSEPHSGAGVSPAPDRGAIRYQILVPSYTVMFAFFLVLTVGWLFVGERRQGTLKRLRAAPLSRTQILLGKLVPCFLLSLGQGFFLLGAGKLVFGMSWGPDPLWLLPVVFCTSLAAMGMALFVASLARTETQVAIYGTLLVLVLAGISGCLMPRDLMPEQMKRLSLITPHAWALEAYSQLLLSSTAGPNLGLVAQACGVLAAFGAGFVLLAWWFLRLD